MCGHDVQQMRAGGEAASYAPAGALLMCAPFSLKRDAAARGARMMVKFVTSWREQFRARGVTAAHTHFYCGPDGPAVPTNSKGCGMGVQPALAQLDQRRG